MIRILHTADIHLDSPLRSLAMRSEELQGQVKSATRSALMRMVDFAIEEQIDALLIAGDMYDGTERSAKTAAFLVAQLDRLNTAGIAVFLIKGNHDAENPVAGEVSLPQNVHVFDGRGGKAQLHDTDVWVHGVSFSGKHAPDSLLPKFSGPVAGAVNIAMLHTSLAGSAGHDPYAPCSVAELAAMGYDYWALGHVHIRQVHSDTPWIVMPGMPQGRDIGEAGPKSATLLTIEDGQINVSEVPTSQVEFIPVTIDATGITDEEDLRKILRRRMDEAASARQSDSAILRVSFTGETPLAWRIHRDRDLWIETAHAASEESGAWVEKVRFTVTAEQGRAEEGTDAAADLHALMDTIRGEDAFRAKALADVQAMLALLPADRRAALTPNEDAATALSEQLAGQGATRMIARMKGAGS